MRAILVDDEKIPLAHLKGLLETESFNIEIIGAYLNPLEAEKMIKRHKPDIVFLDIEMPELTGLQLGERIQESHPEIEIIFVTAFDTYAIEAFKLYAIDYIMKPIRPSRLKTTIERLRKRLPKHHNNGNEIEDNAISLSCFNSVNIYMPTGEFVPMKWRTSKAQELFAYMLHHQDQLIYRDTMLELLWPDFEMSRGLKQLYTTIYHIRQTLKNYGLEEIQISRPTLDNGYRLKIGTVRIDTVEWMKQLALLNPLSLESIEDYERVLLSYKGDYLGDYDYLWAEGERERLRHLWQTHAEQLSTFYMNEKMIDNAIVVNECIQQLYPIEEISYVNLMKLYHSLNNIIAVKAQYSKLVIVLEEQLDTIPSQEIVTWYEQWQEKIKGEKNPLL